MRSLAITCALILCVAAATTAVAQQTLDRPLQAPQPFVRDSGPQTNFGRTDATVYSDTVSIEGAGWMRLYFGNDVVLPAGSFIRLTSSLDGEVQELDAADLEMWNYSSAYFNGGHVELELVAAPGTTGNRLVTAELAYEAGLPLPPGGCGICGADDRVQSSETWSNRILPAGCSAAVYNTDSCVVSAGHCASSGMVLQFNVPLSNSNCNINQPPVADQFPVQQFNFTNGGVGNDWMVLKSGTNNLGQKPFDRFGELRPLASSPASTNDAVSIWGYGVDSQCTLSQVQQLSTGNVTGVSGTFFNHNADATFGNSGSSILRNGQEIIGIVTHCPCPNYATRIDHPNFVAARETLCPSSPPMSASLDGLNVLLGGTTNGGIGDLDAADGLYFTVDAAPGGTRNNALTEIFASSPVTTVNGLNVTVQTGPVDASPVFMAVALFNFDTGVYVTQSFQIASTTTDSVVALTDVPNANAYVSNGGEIRVRVAHTARAAQTPSGFTKLLDLVEVTVQP